MGRQLLGVPTERYRPASKQVGEDGSVETGAVTDESRSMLVGRSLVDNIKDAIPVEIVTAWAAIDAVLGPGFPGDPFVTYWGLFVAFTVGTAVHMWVDVERPTEERADRLGVPLEYLRYSYWGQIALAVGSFVVWAYYLGGPFQLPPTDWYVQSYAAVLLPTFVTFGPQLVPAVLRKVYRVEKRPEKPGIGGSDPESES